MKKVKKFFIRIKQYMIQYLTTGADERIYKKYQMKENLLQKSMKEYSEEKVRSLYIHEQARYTRKKMSFIGLTLATLLGFEYGRRLFSLFFVGMLDHMKIHTVETVMKKWDSIEGLFPIIASAFLTFVMIAAVIIYEAAKDVSAQKKKLLIMEEILYQRMKSKKSKTPKHSQTPNKKVKVDN